MSSTTRAGAGHQAGHPLDQHLTPGTLRLLTLVHELGGVGAAARTLGMTQPSASRTLSALERRLGVPLLDRSPRGTTLTVAGLAVCAQARAVLQEQDRLEGVIAALSTAGPERLELAASRTIGEHLVPVWLGAQAAAHPGTWVSFRFDNSANVARWVADGVVPLGFVEDPTTPELAGAEGLRSEVLRLDRLRIIVPPTHPWAGDTIGPDDLAATALVEREAGSGTRATLDAALPTRRRALAELDSNEAIVRAVAAGVGPAVLSEMAVASHVEAGTVASVEWDGPALERPLRAIWRGDTRVPRPVAEFLALVRRALA